VWGEGRRREPWENADRGQKADNGEGKGGRQHTAGRSPLAISGKPPAFSTSSASTEMGASGPCISHGSVDRIDRNGSKGGGATAGAPFSLVSLVPFLKVTLHAEG
jgi:hypothetical protein